MPRDDWAKARSRDAARRGKRMEKIPRGRRHKKQRKHLSVASRKPAAIPQCRCGQSAVSQTPRTFKDGQNHIEVRCQSCGTFIKWL